MFKMIFLPLNIRDYAFETKGMTAEQCGCYVNILIKAWGSGGFVPDDDNQLAIIAGVSKARWRKSVRAVMLRLFTVDERGWHHAEMLRAIARVKAQLKGFTYRNQADMEFFESDRWRELRAKTLDRYGPVCMKCGADRTSEIIHIDHIHPRSIFPELQWDEDNLQVLCEPCNVEKSNKYVADYRPIQQLN